jgi:hypothetical protein
MAKRHKKSHKKCIVSSGPKKGKLKKGWRLSKRAGCVQAKGKKSRKSRRSKRSR